METANKVRQLAREAFNALETKERDNGQSYVSFNSDKKETWMQDLADAAHGDMMPDDWKYSALQSALEFIADTDSTDDVEEIRDGISEWADGMVDVYDFNLKTWLTSHGDRQGYVDEAVSEFGHSENEIIGDITLGQFAEYEEVCHLALTFLEGRAESEIEDEDAA